MNLIEFPLAVLADSAPQGQKTLEFSDSIFDKASGQYIERRCIVTGSDKWGLPNWFDIDIVLALMKLTKQQNGFRERNVRFSLYEVREVLGVPRNHGGYKKRLKEGLLRILGTTVAYENAWRVNGKWKSTTAFHLLDNLELTNTQEFRDDDSEQHLKWNERVVESVQAENTKGLDWEFYRSLKKPSAKRLYRFLDKRFALGPKWSYNLTAFCPNKLGMAEGQDAWVYRKSLKPGIAELVERGVLQDLGDELFTRVGSVSYVNFRRKLSRTPVPPKSEAKAMTGALEQQLLDRGVSNAAELVARYPEPKIRDAMENFDDRNGHGENKQPGWLRKAIEDEKGFSFRRGYKSKAQRADEAIQSDEQRNRRLAERQANLQKAKADKQRTREKRAELERLWSSLGAARQIELEDEAMNECENAFIVDGVRRARREGEPGCFHEMLWSRFIIPKHFDGKA